MELPPKLTTDLKIVQHQMKLEIQTHQIMRIKQANDPDNFKCLQDLREIEKRISSLGERQKQLMKWLRKILTAIPSNSAMLVKTVASSLGITVNGTHPSLGMVTNNISTSNKCISPPKKNVCGPMKDNFQSSGLKKSPMSEEKCIEDESTGNFVESKAALKNREAKAGFNSVPEICSAQNKIGKQEASQKKDEIPKIQISDCKESPSEPLTVEKEKFLSAVGLVTRDVLKELQNRRVERKRRSTANHTQFVYGSNWDISSKKRKKSNYLASASSAANQVTRPASKPLKTNMETVIISAKLNPTVSIFKTPLPVSILSSHEPVDNAISTRVHTQKSVAKVAPAVTNDVGPVPSISPSEVTATVVCKSKEEACFICKKPDSNTIVCSCSIHYHHSCADEVENCLGCGRKLKNIIADRRAEKHRLQEMNSRLNSEKQELEIRAAELNVTLATQAEQKKNLLSLEEDVRRKIQQIHEFVAIMKNSHSLSSS